MCRSVPQIPVVHADQDVVDPDLGLRDLAMTRPGPASCFTRARIRPLSQHGSGGVGTSGGGGEGGGEGGRMAGIVGGGGGDGGEDRQPEAPVDVRSSSRACSLAEVPPAGSPPVNRSRYRRPGTRPVRRHHADPHESSHVGRHPSGRQGPVLDRERRGLRGLLLPTVSRTSRGRTRRTDRRALASCFSMALAGDLGRAGHAPESVRTVATVHLDKVERGFAITGSTSTRKPPSPDRVRRPRLDRAGDEVELPGRQGSPCPITLRNG